MHHQLENTCIISSWVFSEPVTKGDLGSSEDCSINGVNFIVFNKRSACCTCGHSALQVGKSCSCK